MVQQRVDSVVARQVKFSNGEISPSMHADVSHPKWASSLRTCKNWLPIPQGALVTRPGTKIIAPVKDSSYKPILRAFIFSDSVAYVMEFGNLYVRFYQNGSFFLERATPVTKEMLPYLKIAQVGNVLNYTYGGQVAGVAALAPRQIRYDPSVPTFVDAAAPLKSIAITWTGGPSFTVPAYAGGATYARGDRVIANTVEWIMIQDASTGNAPPAPAANAALTGLAGNFFWTPAVDDKHTADTWQWAETVVFQDTIGRTFESAPILSGVIKTALALDRPLGMQAIGLLATVAYTALYYRLYRGKQGGLFGWKADLPTGIGNFTDDGGDPDYTRQPPSGTDPFLVNNAGAVADSYPSVVGYLDQRVLYATSKLVPQGMWLSKDGDFVVWDRPNPGADTDPIFITIAGQKLEQPRAFRPMRRGIILTGQSEWALSGPNGGPISRTGKELKWQSGWGSGWLDPLQIGTGLIFLTSLGDMVRDFFPLYGIYSDIWDGQELSFMARHMFDLHTIKDWDFQQKPYPVIWAVRDDGVLLSCTYMHAPPSFGQQLAEGVVAWAQHTTGGDLTDTFESVCCVPEPPELAVYVVVNRSGTRYIERFANPVPSTNQTYAISLDCCQTRDGRNKGAVTMRLSGGAAYAQGDQVVCTASAAFRPNPTESNGGPIVTWDGSADPGHAQVIFDPDGTQGGPVIAKVVAVAGFGVCTVELQADLTAAQIAAWVAAPTTNWGDAIDYPWIGFLFPHPLAGHASDTLDANGARGFCVLADGEVAQVNLWTGGVFQIAKPALVITAGLSYNCDVELLDAHNPNQDIRNIFKKLTRIGFEVSGTRGVWGGASLANLWEWDQRDLVDAYGLVPLAAGYFEAEVTDSWSKDGRGALRHIDPLPATLMSALREMATGGS